MINIQEIAKNNDFTIESVEVKDHGTVIRGVGLNKLESMRLELFENGHKKPISCHREEGSCEAFMILWNA